MAAGAAAGQRVPRGAAAADSRRGFRGRGPLPGAARRAARPCPPPRPVPRPAAEQQVRGAAGLGPVPAAASRGRRRAPWARPAPPAGPARPADRPAAPGPGPVSSSPPLPSRSPAPPRPGPQRVPAPARGGGAAAGGSEGPAGRAAPGRGGHDLSDRPRRRGLSSCRVISLLTGRGGGPGKARIPEGLWVVPGAEAWPQAGQPRFPDAPAPPLARRGRYRLGESRRPRGRGCEVLAPVP